MERPKTQEQYINYVKIVCANIEQIKAKGLDLVKVLIGGNVRPDGTMIFKNQEFLNVLKEAGISEIKPSTLEVFAKAGTFDKEYMQSLSPEANEMQMKIQAEQTAINITEKNEKLTNEEIAEFQKQTAVQTNTTNTVNEAINKVKEQSKEYKKDDMQIITNSSSNKENLERYLLEATTSKDGKVTDTKDIQEQILTGLHEGYFTIAVVDEVFQKYPDLASFDQIKTELTHMGYYNYYEKDDTAPTTSTGAKRLANLCVSLDSTDTPEYITDNMKNKVDACINFVDNGLVTLEEIKDLQEKGILSEKDYEDVVTANKNDEIMNENDETPNVSTELEPNTQLTEPKVSDINLGQYVTNTNDIGTKILDDSINMANTFLAGMEPANRLENEDVMQMVFKQTDKK